MEHRDGKDEELPSASVAQDRPQGRWQDAFYLWCFGFSIIFTVLVVNFRCTWQGCGWRQNFHSTLNEGQHGITGQSQYLLGVGKADITGYVDALCRSDKY